MHDQYFATLPENEICEALSEKVSNYYDEIDRSGRLGLLRKSHRYYFALDAQGAHEASDVNRGGDQGELSLLKANHYRNLLQHLHVLVTQNRPAFECRAVNTDLKSQIQTILGKNILEYYLRDQRLDLHYRKVAEYAIVYGEGYLELEWDKSKGDVVTTDDEEGTATGVPGAQIKTGEITARTYDPLNVIRPCRWDADSRPSWRILRRWESRYDLAAQHPEQAEKILRHAEDTPDNRLYYYGYAVTDEDDDDVIPVYTFYHDKTPACPNGRKVKFLGDSICLSYEDLDYTEIPVYEMIPQFQHGTSFGYSVAFDLLCVQEAVDMLYSTILSNQAAFGVQNIWMKPGSNLVPSQLAGGLNILESMEKPEPINLTYTPPEIFNFLKGLETLGEVLSGINSVARGQPEASLKSGSALALVASQAVQFSNGLQAAMVRLQEDSGTGIINTLKTRAVLPRATVVAGKDNRARMKDFTGQDLRDINRVVVDLANPMSQTLSGRMQMAQDLLQSQQLRRPEQYMQVITTGRLEPLIDDETTEQLLITAENEALKEGKPVMAIAVDMHKQHISGHRTVLGSVEDRLDPALAERVLAHIQEHLNALRQTDPALLNLLGQSAIQPTPMGAPPPQPQGAEAQQPNAKPEQGAKVPAPQGASPQMAENMPEMPKPANVPGNPAG
jgi:hypothetical protein